MKQVLSPVQKYYISRKKEGETSPHILLSVTCTDFDGKRFEEEWNETINNEEILSSRLIEERCLVTENKSVNRKIMYFDFSDRNNDEAEDELLKVKNIFSSRRLRPEYGQTLGIFVVKMPDGRSVINIDTDFSAVPMDVFISSVSRTFRKYYKTFIDMDEHLEHRCDEVKIEDMIYWNKKTRDIDFSCQTYAKENLKKTTVFSHSSLITENTDITVPSDLQLYHMSAAILSYHIMCNTDKIIFRYFSYKKSCDFIAVLSKISEDDTFLTYMKKLSEAVEKSRLHQSFGAYKVAELIKKSGDIEMAIPFIYTDISLHGIQDAEISDVYMSMPDSNCILSVYKNGEKTKFDISFNSGFISENEISTYLGSLKEIIRRTSSDPDIMLKDLMKK